MAEKRTAIIIGSLVIVAVVFMAGWVLTAPETAPDALAEITNPTDVQSAVLLDSVSILTGENYFGHRVRVIRGWLTNLSDRPIRMVEVKFTFTDYEGKPVQESVHRTFEPSQRPIDPGTKYRFDINFENLPREWNYRIPVTEVVKVGF